MVICRMAGNRTSGRCEEKSSSGIIQAIRCTNMARNKRVRSANNCNYAARVSDERTWRGDTFENQIQMSR